MLLIVSVPSMVLRDNVTYCFCTISGSETQCYLLFLYHQWFRDTMLLTVSVPSVVQRDNVTYCICTISGSERQCGQSCIKHAHIICNTKIIKLSKQRKELHPSLLTLFCFALRCYGQISLHTIWRNEWKYDGTRDSQTGTGWYASFNICQRYNE